ncbi:MAG: hypothetical protein JNM84_13550 [Planctomycetes bacterium]|nr:hypothetical protein [Planctomycetota bacterium]
MTGGENAGAAADAARGAWRGALLCGAAAFSLYLATFSPRAFALLWADDGMHYARWAVDGVSAQLAHPHHVLYHYLARGLMLALEPFCGAGIETSLRAHQILSALGGALGVACTFLLARRLGAGNAIAATLALFVATAFPYWCFSSVSETYAPAHACVAALFATLLFERREDPLRRRSALPIALIALGFALREDYGLCLPAYALGIWSVHGFAKGTQRGALVAALSLGITAAIYGAVYLLFVQGTSFAPKGFGSWFAGYQEDGRYGIIERYFEARLPLELQRLGESVFPWWAAWHAPSFALVGAYVVPLLALAALIAGLRSIRSRALALAAGAYLVLRVVFFAWWECGYFDFELGHVAALGFLLASAVPALRNARVAFVAASALLLLATLQVAHVSGSRLPPFRDEGAFERVLQLGRSLEPGEAVAGLRTETRLGSIGYLGREVLELDPRRFVAQIEQWLAAHPGLALFLPAIELQAIADPSRPEWGELGAAAPERLVEQALAWEALLARERPALVADNAGAPLGWRFRRS